MHLRGRPHRRLFLGQNGPSKVVIGLISGVSLAVRRFVDGVRVQLGGAQNEKLPTSVLRSGHHGPGTISLH